MRLFFSVLWAAAGFAVISPTQAQPADSAPLAMQMPDNAAPIAGGFGQTRQETHNGIIFRIKPYAETWRGLPGYAAKVDYLTAESAAFPRAADIGEYINGKIIGDLFAMRLDVLSAQSPQACSNIKTAIPEKGESACQYQISEILKDVHSIGSLLSVHYNTASATAGTAYSDIAEKTYNFSLSPLFRIDTLPDIFADSDTALTLMQEYIRAGLSGQKDAAGKPAANQDIIEQATADWTLFDNFVFSKDGIAVYFAPGIVADAALGERMVTVPYALVENYFTPFYRAALGLDK